jgi:hypothetical protein
MRLFTLEAPHRFFKRLPNDRMQEPHRLVWREHLKPDQRLGQALRPCHHKRSDRRRVTNLAAITEDGKRLRQGQRGRIKPHHPRYQPRRGVLLANRKQAAQVELVKRTAIRLDRPNELVEIKRVPPHASWIAAHNSSLTSNDRTSRTTPATAALLSAAGRTISASPRIASNAGLLDTGSSGRSAAIRVSGKPSIRGAR